ncbi:hypothetical protein [Acinetobacter beijerinckii]|uniref:Uncharacterized protein n=1 Tax=Acinetobacter beijerinckii CIP 110307 TaxID=1217648 RepID=N9DXG4_9GAMM|nr:hypothetical protein [Acinetobacter beijerinckii]ENW02918.1 hypothetical protein F933_03324 [Acinetobacter beijerinckii CIP 110307]
MGSPNFYTSNEALLNFGIDFDSNQDEELFWSDVRDKIGESLDKANDQLTFHKIIESFGYHSGMQIYLVKPNSASYYWENYAQYWNEENDAGFYNEQGYWVGVSLNAEYQSHVDKKTFSFHHLVEIINSEYQFAEKLIKQIAQTYSFGEVVGKGFTSSVKYGWFVA